MAKHTNNGPAPKAAAPVPADSIADAMAKRLSDNAAKIRGAYELADNARDVGGFPALIAASEAFGMTADELRAWIKPTKEDVTANKFSAVEQNVRNAHMAVAKHSPQTRKELGLLIGRASRASSVDVVSEVRETLGRKNFPSNKATTDAERKEALQQLKDAANAPDPTGRNELTDAQRALNAVNDPQALARLDRELNALQVRGTTWRASLLLKFVGDVILQACEDCSVTPASVWEKATLAAGSAHNKLSAEDTQRAKPAKEYVEAVRKAARDYVEKEAANRNTIKAKPVQSDTEKHAAAILNVFRGLKALLSLDHMSEDDYNYLRSYLVAKCGYKDQDREDEKAKETARENAKLAKQAERKAASVLVPKAVEASIPAPSAPVVQAPEVDAAKVAAAAAAAKAPKGRKQNFGKPKLTLTEGPSTQDVLDDLEGNAA
jgi:hypothetical protein